MSRRHPLSLGGALWLEGTTRILALLICLMAVSVEVYADFSIKNWFSGAAEVIYLVYIAL